MRPHIYEIGQYAAGAVGAIAAGQAPTANTPLTLTSDPFIQDVPRTVALTFALGFADGIRFSIFGEGPKGNAIYDTIISADNTQVEGSLVFSKIISITPDTTDANNVSADTVDAVPTPWYPLDYVVHEFRVGVLLEIVGTVTTGALLQATKDQLGYNDANPIRGGHHGSVFKIEHPIKNIADITNEILGAATIGTDTLANGEIREPWTAIRALSQEALDADELLRFQVLQGHS